jgi:hypothetical protein
MGDKKKKWVTKLSLYFPSISKRICIGFFWPRQQLLSHKQQMDSDKKREIPKTKQKEIIASYNKQI